MTEDDAAARCRRRQRIQDQRKARAMTELEVVPDDASVEAELRRIEEAEGVDLEPLPAPLRPQHARTSRVRGPVEAHQPTIPVITDGPTNGVRSSRGMHA
jgi:hypothetical protein